MDFTNPNYNYSNCLISRFIDSEYTPVPVIKIYDKSNKKSSLRSVYALLGDEPVDTSLILEETIDKIPIDSVEISDLVYNYNFEVSLTNEVKKEDVEIKHGSKEAGNTEYQNRYSITNISKFWRVDIIEYGNSKDLKQAKTMWEQKPRTRIEIEYAPASYSEDLLKWENEGVLDLALKQLGFSGLTGMEQTDEYVTRDVLLTKLENYKTILNNSDPHEVLRDLGNVLIKIFTVLDMDVGNNYGEQALKKEKKEKKPQEEMEEPEAKPEKVEKVEKVEKKEESGFTKESIFSRLRKFHNYIKAELIGEVAGFLSKPISLLDISVGKGGDIQKWEHADIDIVYGIDPDQESIKEARERLKEMTKEGRVKTTRKYTFEQKAIADPNTYINKKFDIVSCQFTLHYFFVNDDVLEMVISKVSSSLKQGGYFIGTTLLGANVKKLIKDNKFKDKVELKEVDESSYRMKLLDTAQIYNKDLLEYYVDFDKFKRICGVYGLELREAKQFADVYKVYKKDSKNKKHLLKDYELAVSSLNTTFIFQKS